MAEQTVAPQPAGPRRVASMQHDVVPVPLGRRGTEPIHVYRWEHPAPRSTVVVAHGAGEHGARYAALADDLVAAGHAVVAFDNLGHGRTGLAADGLGELGRGGNRAAARCLVEVLTHVRHARPDVPLVLYGHSWGSLLAQQALANHAHLLDALVLSGTALALPGLLNAGDLNRPWRADDPSGLHWLSRDPAAREAFASDPLCFDIAEQPVWSPVQSLQLLHVPPPARAARVDDVPVLILAGSRDSVAFGVRGSAALARAYRRRTGLSDVTHAVFPEARHELVNETNRDEVVAVLVAWLAARFGAPHGAPAGAERRDEA